MKMLPIREETSYRLFMAERDFSATETALNKSSIVEMKVSMLVLHFRTVLTFVPFVVVRIVRSLGTFMLSGDTAAQTASASLLVLYESEISASKFRSFQLTFDK